MPNYLKIKGSCEIKLSKAKKSLKSKKFKGSFQNKGKIKSLKMCCRWLMCTCSSHYKGILQQVNEVSKIANLMRVGVHYVVQTSSNNLVSSPSLSLLSI